MRYEPKHYGNVFFLYKMTFHRQSYDLTYIRGLNVMTNTEISGCVLIPIKRRVMGVIVLDTQIVTHFLF